MLSANQQQGLFDTPDFSKAVEAFVRGIVASPSRPSPGELVAKLDKRFGSKARWDLERLIWLVAHDPKIPRFDRDYLASLLADDNLSKALRGEDVPESKKKISTIDELFRHSKLYRNSGAFNELIRFMGRFREYAPYNNMLVRLQNPSCSFYAREKDWYERFNRHLIDDARPMLILAPKHPVLLVYDVDQTEGAELPKELQDFARFEGEWDPAWLSNAVGNAAGHRIRVDFRTSLKHERGLRDVGAQIGRLENADRHTRRAGCPSRFGVLCHELAHILLGHLGTDWDQWWPGWLNLDKRTVEIEAESVAYIVTSHLGLKGSSAAYVSRHLKDGKVPERISRLHRQSRRTHRADGDRQNAATAPTASAEEEAASKTIIIAGRIRPCRTGL